MRERIWGKINIKSDICRYSNDYNSNVINDYNSNVIATSKVIWFIEMGNSSNWVTDDVG